MKKQRIDQKLDTIKKLYDWSSEGYGNEIRVSLPCDTLAALCAYATSIGVKAGHANHATLMAACRAKARGLRYRHMAESVLPSSDYLYDPRHSDAEELGYWSTGLLIPEDKG